MGQQFLDQYSLLHASSGVAAYFWGIPLWKWSIAHVVFEFLENTEGGMKIINENIPFWPGGKPKADRLINIVGDNLSAILGWLTASAIDKRGKNQKWYDARIN